MSQARFRRAIVRLPGPNLADGLTRVDLGKPSLGLALEQHRHYCEALRCCGLEIERLPADARFPDGTFVEDTAVLANGAAMLARPGAPSRLGEVDAIRDALRAYGLPIATIDAPGTLDGGDVCEAGDHVFIGISERTNMQGAEQLAEWLRGQGLSSTPVDIRTMTSILHLKSGLAWLGARRLLVIDELAGLPAFAGFDLVRVAPHEAYAANAVCINDHVLIASGHPQLAAELAALRLDTIALDMSEFARLDGGLSCLSLRF